MVRSCASRVKHLIWDRAYEAVQVNRVREMLRICDTHGHQDSGNFVCDLSIRHDQYGSLCAEVAESPTTICFWQAQEGNGLTLFAHGLLFK